MEQAKKQQKGQLQSQKGAQAEEGQALQYPLMGQSYIAAGARSDG